MELMELRLFAAAPLTPRGVLSEDMIFFFFKVSCLCFGFLICGLRVVFSFNLFARVSEIGCDENDGSEGL